MLKNKAKLSLSILSIGFFCFLNLLSAAEPITYSKENPFILRGIRPLGMGGAGIALSDDENAFFYNPAGVTERKRWMLTVLNLNLTVNQDLLDSYKWLGENATGDGKNNGKDLDGYKDLTSEQKQKLLSDISAKASKYNNHVMISAPNMNYISGPIGGKTFWGIGAFDNADVRFRLNAEKASNGNTEPNLDIDGNVDAAGILLLAHKFTDKFSLGVNTKFLGRSSLQERKLSVLEIDGYSPLVQFGTGVGADLGATYKLQDNLKLGLTVSDIGGTVIKYEKVDAETTDNGTIKPGKVERQAVIYPRLNVGVAYKPLKQWFNVFFVPDVTFAMDFMDLTDSAGDGVIKDFSEFMEKTHVGTEFAWKFLALRAGVSSGYPTVGIGLSMWSLKLDYAYYTDKITMFGNENKSELNHTIALSWRFGTTVSRDKKKQ